MIKEKALIQKKPIRERIHEIDLIRGICIILMCMDHFMWDMTSRFGGIITILFGFNPYSPDNPSWLEGWLKGANFYYGNEFRHYIRLIIIAIFFILSGISCYLSKSNFKRGSYALGFGLVITFATLGASLLIPGFENTFIPFGVMSCFGLSIIIYAFLNFLSRKAFKEHHQNIWKYIALLLGIIFVSLGVGFGYYGSIESAIPPTDVKSWLEVISGSIVGSTRYGADFFPIFPYVGFIFIGAFIGETVFKEKKSLVPGINNAFTRPIFFIGRKTIWVYIIHQVVFIILYVILFLALGFKLNF